MPSLPLPHYLKPSLPSHISPQRNSTDGLNAGECNETFALIGDGLSNGWVGRGRYGFLKSKNTHKKVAGALVVHTLFYKSSAMLHFVCALWTERGHTHTNQVVWLLASLSRHHIEAQRECVTDPHSEGEGWQDGYRNMRCVSCVLHGFESTQCIFLTYPPLHSSSLIIWLDLSFLSIVFNHHCCSHWSYGEGLWLVEVTGGWDFLADRSQDII